MRRTSWSVSVIALMLLLALGPAGAALGAVYSFTPIDAPFPEVIETEATDINNLGQVVGRYLDTSGNHGFLYSGGVFSSFDLPFPVISLDASGINDSGQIVGVYAQANGSEHGFLYEAGRFSPIDVPFPGAFGTAAGGVNNLGQIVGTYFDAAGIHGFLDSGGVFSAIDVPGGRTTEALGINDIGQIVGRYDVVPRPPRHGFLESSGVFSPIDVPFGGVDATQAFGINDVGQIVGYYADAAGNHGFLDDGGIFTAIDAPFAANLSTAALGINDAGQIVGIYQRQVAPFNLHGFLATPVPEPATLILLGFALTALGLRAYLSYKADRPPKC